MAIFVSDNFTRADDPTGLGIATTGQSWSTISGDWAIVSNEATRSNASSLFGVTVIPTGTADSITTVTLVNPESLPSLASFMGLIARYVDSTHYYSLTYERFPGGANRLRLKLVNGGTTTIRDQSITLSNGDTIGLGCCGTTLDVYVNGALQGTRGASASWPTGTNAGLTGYGGTIGLSVPVNEFANFLVETNGTCTPTYNCTGGACVDPGDGTGTYATLAACLEGCSVATSYDCVDGQCIDPGDGSGTYASLAECAASGCGAITVETVSFDQGTGSGYYYVAPIVDSGDELRSKTVKSVRATGKFTSAATEIYGYDISDVVNVSDLEQGLNSSTGQVAIDDTGGVAQTPRKQVNVPNAVLHTVRIVGDDTGETTRDRIDEIVTEQSDIGVRR